MNDAPKPLPVETARGLADRVRKDFDLSAETVVTCEDCDLNATCDLAFDPYNTDGDCLAMK